MFLEGDGFPFLEPLRQAWSDIRAECLAVGENAYEPWVQREMQSSSGTPSGA